MALTVDEFNELMRRQASLVKRKVRIKKPYSEEVVKGTTVTDDRNVVSFIYDRTRRMLTVLNRQEQKLFRGRVLTPEDFERALTKADKKQRNLRG